MGYLLESGNILDIILELVQVDLVIDSMSK